MSFLYFLLIGALSGWLAGQFWKGSGFGILGNVVVGIIGGLVGGFLAGKLGFSASSLLAQILVAAGGAWVLLYIINLFKSK